MQNVACILCGETKYQVIYPSTLGADVPLHMHTVRCTSSDYRNHAQIVRCTGCGHLYANPRWTEQELLAAYAAVEDDTYVDEEEGRRLTFERRLEEMERVTGPANGRSLLDVGAYTGIFVEIAAKAGWKARGVELSHWCVAVAQRRGLPVMQGTLDTPSLREERFAVLTLWDVIEHMDDPAAEVRKARTLLAEGGTLVLHTMDVGSLCARCMRSRWPWFLGMHLHFFSKKSLCGLLEREGFRILKAGASGRTLRLGYFSDSLAKLMPLPGKPLRWLVKTLHIGWIPLRLNFGDLFTVYAQKEEVL